MTADAPELRALQHERSRRLFFALWPDERMRVAMVRATRKAAQSAGRPVPAANLHLTLAFLGSVPERRLGELGEIARASAASSTDLELAFDRLEYWRTAELLCALPAERSAPMGALARSLQDRLIACGFAPDLKPFRPHVTVVRKVSRRGHSEPLDSVVWSFTALALIESRTLPEGALYSVIESYPLCSARKSANNSETT